MTIYVLLIGKFNSKLNFYKLIPYLVDRCICPAPCRSRQTLEKNVLSWALAGTGSVLFIRQPAGVLRMLAHALFLFLLPTLEAPFFWSRIAGKAGWESPCPLGKVLTYKNLIYY